MLKKGDKVKYIGNKKDTKKVFNNTEKDMIIKVEMKSLYIREGDKTDEEHLWLVGNKDNDGNNCIIKSDNLIKESKYNKIK